MSEHRWRYWKRPEKNYKIEKAIKIPSSSLGLFNIFIGYVEDLRQQNIYIRPNEFEKIEEKELFEKLIKIKGIGPKIAFKVVSNSKGEELRFEKIITIKGIS
mgnify:CR=1 FL=1